MIERQGPMTLGIYRVLMETMQELLVTNDSFDEVYEYALRVDFQGRGTLHIHVVTWAILQRGVEVEGRVVDKRWSPFVRLFHDLFKSIVDVQLGAYHNYIVGYISKAPGAMIFPLVSISRLRSTMHGL